MQKSNVTIYQIAEESGVSVSTVSRVLNGGAHVSAKSAERVKAVIEKYHYYPSTLARALSSNRTQMIGVIMPDITNPYFSALFLEIQRQAVEYDYSILLCNTLYGGSSHGIRGQISEMQYFQMMIDKKVDGVIVTGGEQDKDDVSSEYIEALNALNRQIPVVAIGTRVEGCECMFVHRNITGGIAPLIQHFVALGKKRIGIVGGELGIKTTTLRFEAFRRTLESLSLPLDPDIVGMSDYYLPDGYEATKRILLRAKTPPDAIIAINDAVAMGAIRAIFDAGLRVPEDIALASCDQFFEAEYTVPRLTSIDQQNGYLSHLAVTMLISAINNEVSEPIAIDHTPRLVIRESCGARL